MQHPGETAHADDDAPRGPRPARLFLFLAGCRTTQDVESRFLPEREPWLRVHAADDGHATIVESIPKGPELGGWGELMTIQASDDRLPPEPPLRTMETLRASVQGHGGRLEWNVVGSDADSALYEWALVGAPEQPDPGEIARLVLGNDTTHRVAYA